jgi:hypothetical protein
VTDETAADYYTPGKVAVTRSGGVKGWVGLDTQHASALHNPTVRQAHLTGIRVCSDAIGVAHTTACLGTRVVGQAAVGSACNQTPCDAMQACAAHAHRSSPTPGTPPCASSCSWLSSWWRWRCRWGGVEVEVEARWASTHTRTHAHTHTRTHVHTHTCMHAHTHTHGDADEWRRWRSGGSRVAL